MGFHQGWSELIGNYNLMFFFYYPSLQNLKLTPFLQKKKKRMAPDIALTCVDVIDKKYLEIQKQIGRGGCGVVYKGVLKGGGGGKQGREVAVKELLRFFLIFILFFYFFFDFNFYFLFIF